MQFTRRNFLGSASATVVVRSLLSRTILPAGMLMAAATSAHAQWTVALAAANVALSALLTFSKSDGGLSTMLSPLNQKVDLVVGQLNEVRNSLFNLELEIRKLPADLKLVVLGTYRDSLIDRINGAVLSYTEIKSAVQRDQNIEQSRQILDRLRAVADDASLTFRQLAVSADGFGPEATLVMPAAMFLEIASASTLKFPTSYIVQNLRTYRRQLVRCMGAEEKSIMFHRKGAVEAHANIIAEVQKTRLGKEFNFSELAFDEAKKGQSTAGVDFCLVFSPHLADSFADSPAKVQQGLEAIKFFTAGGTFFEQTSSIESAFEKSLNSYQLRYRHGIKSITWARSGTVSGLGPRAKSCYVRKAMPIHEVDAADAFAMRTDVAGIVAGDREKMGRALSSLNLQRAKIALCDEAYRVAGHAREAAERQLKALGESNE